MRTSSNSAFAHPLVIARNPSISAQKNSKRVLFRTRTQRIADELVARKVLRHEDILEIQHLDPKWMVALYVRAVRFGLKFGFRPDYI